MSKRTPSARSTGRRQRILEAALRCFLEQGFDGTTMDQIRRASGASHGSIYHHFGSKEAIALSLYVDGLHEYHARVYAALRQQTTAREGIRAIIRAHLASVAADPHRSLFLTRMDLADTTEETAGGIAEVNQEFFRAISEWLKPYLDRGEVIRVPASLYVPLVLGPTAHFCRHWLAQRMALDMDEVAETFAAAAWKSLTTSPEEA
jgi:AcrR family transcriptional regulator